MSQPEDFLNRLYQKLVHGGGFFTFLRSSVAAQLASWLDMGTSILLVALGVSSWIATPVGAVLGGVVNCCINYKFTFKASDVSPKAVAVKYLLIWIGSVLFNTVGTALLARALDRWHLLEMMGFTNTGSFATARVIVSLVVSLAWNFLMQKHFVYRRRPGFDPYADRLVDGLLWILPLKKQNKYKITTTTMAKSLFNRLRDALQQGIYSVINPFVRFLIKIGVTPNMVTTIGFLGNLAAAAMFVYAGIIHRHELSVPDCDHFQYGWIGAGGAILLLFSLFDMLDGQVARLGNMQSTFGAMYDSVLDRYSELVTLGGITFYLLELQTPLGEVGSLITFIALIGSIMVSYVRARAEGLDIECKVGFMQRPERVVITSLAALVTGIVGKSAAVDSDTALYILIGGMGVIAVFANITALARINHVRRALGSNTAKDKENTQL